jgi:hypothetical protein
MLVFVPLLLGWPWLYLARVLVDWGAKEFVIGKSSIRIPWKTKKHLGETSDLDGYKWRRIMDLKMLYSNILERR